MDKKDMNIFKPMVITEPISFENIDDVIKFGNKQNIAYMDDSMGIPDKIKMLTTIISSVYFGFVIRTVDYDSLMKAIQITQEYLSTIPNNSIEILNAKNEFTTTSLMIIGTAMRMPTDS